MRKFGFVVMALPLANVHCAHKYFVNGSNDGGFKTTKADFVRVVMAKLI